MKRKEMMDAIIDAKIESISQGGTCEEYLREALRYGLSALVDMSDDELRFILDEHNLTEEDI